jgi:hypothetical protein
MIVGFAQGRGNMNDVSRSGNHASAALIDAAIGMLAKRKPDIPGDFLAKLFNHAAPEDLQRYSAAELAGVAE